MIAIATDLAEFLGAALGMHLLLRDRAFPAALLTAVAAFAILGLQRFGFRPLEATIGVIVLSIGLCYVVELFKARPDFAPSASTPCRPSSRAAARFCSRSESSARP